MDGIINKIVQNEYTGKKTPTIKNKKASVFTTVGEGELVMTITMPGTKINKAAIANVFVSIENKSNMYMKLQITVDPFICNNSHLFRR